jgi:hypothetical protein
MARSSPAFSTLMLFMVVIGCAGFLLWQPRRIALTQMPPLVLPAGPVREAIAAEAKAAAQAPTTEAAAQLDRLWLEAGRIERDGDEPLHRRRERWRRAHTLYEQVVKESGENGALALRALAVERLDDAIDLKLKPELARDVMGDFALLLEREGCARGGELLAPRFIARILYKARWNISHELPPEHRFSSIEARAYFGWQSLHGDRLPLEQRMRALVEYQRHGGPRADEAAGVLLRKGGEAAAANAALTAAYRSSNALRLRNAALAEAGAATQ